MNDFDKSPDQVADEARQVGQDAVYKAKSIGADAKQVANDAVDAGRAYAKGAVSAVGKKMGDVKSQLTHTTDYVTKAINDEPVKAVVVTALISSLITALLISAMRTDRHYYH